MDIFKKYKKLFIVIGIVAVILAILPTIGIVMFSSMSLSKDVVEEVVVNEDISAAQEKVDDYFNNGGLEKDIENAMRKNPSGDFNIYSTKLDIKDERKIEDSLEVTTPTVLELTRLKKNKKYNLKVYSDYYEGKSKVSSEELSTLDIVGSEKIYIIYSDTFMSGGSRRDMKLYIVQDNKILNTLGYYTPTNYNEMCVVNDADFNRNEDIPIFGFVRGYKVNDKYKTDSPNFAKDKSGIEKSINSKLEKNEKMVILRLGINEL